MENQNRSNTLLPILQNGVAQIALVVNDLDQIVENYWQTFGIGPWEFYTYQRPLLSLIRYYGQDIDHSFRIALSYFGPTRIELIEIQEGDSIQADFIQAHGYGVQHLGILVDDIQAALQEARAKGFKVIQEGSGFGLDGDGHYAYLDTEAQYGITYELIERPKRRRPPDKIFPETL